MHTGSVVLVLNSKTGHVSLQLHVVFDDNFSTVSHVQDEQIPPTWEHMCKNTTELAIDEVFNLTEIWLKQLTQRILSNFLINWTWENLFPRKLLILASIKVARETMLEQQTQTIRPKPQTRNQYHSQQLTLW